MANPYQKYLKGEDKLQRAIINYLEFNYPNSIFTHPMNEGKRTPFEQYKMKYLGAKPGIPDLLIFTPNDNFNGLAIELKYKYNKPTENQKKWLEWLKTCKWATYWSNDLDECIEIIDNYFTNNTKNLKK